MVPEFGLLNSKGKEIGTRAPLPKIGSIRLRHTNFKRLKTKETCREESFVEELISNDVCHKGRRGFKGVGFGI
jgi:hypothetical protein